LRIKDPAFDLRNIADAVQNRRGDQLGAGSGRIGSTQTRDGIPGTDRKGHDDRDRRTVGLPELRAGTVLQIEGVGARFSGRWFVTSSDTASAPAVTHKLRL